MPKASTLSIYAFGGTALITGAANLIFRTHALSSLHLPNTPNVRPASDGLALAATAMGIYYIQAAIQENREFYVLTVPMTMLTAGVFLSYRGVWRIAALWEGLGALTTAVVFVWEQI